MMMSSSSVENSVTSNAPRIMLSSCELASGEEELTAQTKADKTSETAAKRSSGADVRIDSNNNVLKLESGNREADVCMPPLAPHHVPALHIPTTHQEISDRPSHRRHSSSRRPSSALAGNLAYLDLSQLGIGNGDETTKVLTCLIYKSPTSIISSFAWPVFFNASFIAENFGLEICVYFFVVKDPHSISSIL